MVNYESTNRESIGSKWSDWPVIVISGLILLWATQPWQVLQIRDAALLSANALAVIGLLWWADQYEREPLRTISWAFLWGAFPAVIFAIGLQYQWTTLFGGVVIEELVKLAGLILIMRRGSIQSWSDGLVMGGFIGLGFATFEDLIYAINGDDSFSTLIARGIFSIFAHTFFSGLGATLIVFGLLKRRWWLSAIGFALAISLHLVWNTLLALDVFNYSGLAFFIFYSLLPPVVLFIAALLLRKHDKNTLLTKGYKALEAGLIDESYLLLISSLRLRRKYYKSFANKDEKRQAKATIYDDTRRLLQHN
jgi:RsiW-degrading membrane proteinase PrsW (M82 family)